MEHFGTRIRRARERAGMTQEELATACGVSRPAVSQWESGNTNALRATSLYALARTLGVSMQYIMEGEPDGVVAEQSATYRTPSEARLIAKYLAMSDAKRATALRLLEALAKDDVSDKASEM